MQIKIGTDEVFVAIVKALSMFGPLDLDGLVKIVPAYDKSLFSAISVGLSSGKFERIGNKISLVAAPHGTAPVVPECPCCRGRLAVPVAHADALKERYLEACSSAPTLTYLLNQRPVTRETSWYRALYMALRGDLIGKRIALLGDDDLTSLAIGLLGQDCEIVVFEADDRLVSFLARQADQLAISHFSTVEYNCREDVPEPFKGTFDVALCDPSSSLFQIFLSRCVTLLKPGSGQIIYTFAGPTYLASTLEFQRLATDLKLQIFDMIPAFNRYALVHSELVGGQDTLIREIGGSEDVSFVEALVRLGTTGDTHPLTVGDSNASVKDLYGDRAFQRLQNLENDPASKTEPTEVWNRLYEKFSPKD
ncbi:hypothetical protein C7477_12148 [Phyllobacterium leguminum]|uniref:N(4)-bis(aminopropyl)spermidine synthase C-terminal domain-containing protein n=2 Tax=Phyllobacterium leguminum TaxID=314237 RepID=A0A318SXE8_9HYPH|nr:hypothetical protein C7477_12148 [Phyllobacterium leguminum]